GFRIGTENQGIELMFTMMNNARISVGVQGLAIAERAYQQARAYARSRVQGRVGRPGAGGTIIGHPDIRRMLMMMRADIEAMRALVCRAGAALDGARRASQPAERRERQAEVDLLTPIVKAWCTDTGCELTSLAIQVHGGVGFIEETGVAQHFRDARIAP